MTSISVVGATLPYADRLLPKIPAVHLAVFKRWTRVVTAAYARPVPWRRSDHEFEPASTKARFNAARPDAKLRPRKEPYNGAAKLEPRRRIIARVAIGAEGARQDIVRRILAPTLTPGDIVIIDNLSSHKSDEVREAIEAVGASVRFLPRYSPDFNPIEKAFAKLKSRLRRLAARTVGVLRDALAGFGNMVTPTECRNFFAA